MGKNLFNSIKLTRPKKNYFDLSHDVKLSTNMGQLTPIMAMECVPGDKVTINCESMIRFAPMIAPIMHRVDVSMHYFFVPNRILWDNWETFITDANSGVVAPYLSSVYSNPSAYPEYYKLFDYMGVPTDPSSSAPNLNINALPFAAYQAIYNDYYRDENLISPIDYKLLDGNNATKRADLCPMRNRSWEHDYFTSSLPWAQKGASVDIPIGTIGENAPVFLEQLNYGDTTTLTGTNGNVTITKKDNPDGGSGLFAETSGLDLGSTTINELRRSFRLQEWLEKNARGGTRYIESILSHFGVKSSDARLQRPEYITGVKTPVTISEVLNTTGETSGLPQGNMAGHGISVGSGHNGSYYCEEHGWIIGIMSVMPKTAYQQGLHKSFFKFDNLEYFWPEFAHIGEQEVKNKELYAYTANDEDTFGYVPRYAEYKFIPSRVAGEFKTSLDYWHLGRKFSTQPALNQTFIECSPEATTRIFAVDDPSSDHLYCHIYNQIKAIRPMPKFGTPMGV